MIGWRWVSVYTEEEEATMGARFVDYGKEVKGWDMGFGTEE